MAKQMFAAFCLLLLSGSGIPADAQDRDTKVRKDREQFQDDSNWIYNDLAAGFEQAKQSGKPLLVVIRCIP